MPNKHLKSQLSAHALNIFIASPNISYLRVLVCSLGQQAEQIAPLGLPVFSFVAFFFHVLLSHAMLPSIFGGKAASTP